MTPRELHDKLEPSPSGYFSPSEGGAWVIESPSDQSIILRALSLAAAVDEAGEEVVQSLHIMSIVHMMDPRNRSVIIKAAALLVSQREEIKRKDAEIAGLREGVTVLNKVRALWPEIRQLQDGFMDSDPSAWTEWDQSVRERSIALSFDLNRASRQKE